MFKKPNQAKPKGSKKIRKGDTVIAISGNEKGQKGVVQACKGDKVVVQGLNVRSKHIKRTQENPKGRIVSVELPIHVSNVRVCVNENEGVKLKVRENDQGHRHLVYKQGEEEIVYRSVKKPK